MLQEVCEEICNYFKASRVEGTFTIADGALSPSAGLLEGQRFLIAGSVLNDGMYTFHGGYIMNADDNAGAGLSDETFTGAVIGLSIPPQVIALSAEISEWVGKYGDVINSPYSGESYGGYAYTRASSSKGDGSSASWQDVFRGRLNRWRKVSFQC